MYILDTKSAIKMGRRIKVLRILKGMKQNIMYPQAGLRPAQLSAIELGYELPTKDQLERIAKVLGVAPDYLTQDKITIEL